MAHIDTIHQIIDAWTAGDLDRVLACLDDDITYHYHVGSRPLVGHARVRRFMETFGAGQTDISWRITRHLEAGDVVMVEGVDDYADAEGRRIRVPYMGVFEFRDGKVAAWRDYLDLGLVSAMRSGEPTPEWLEPLIA